MWYPEKRQWAVIWLAVLPAMVLWVNASGARQPEERLAVCLVITRGVTCLAVSEEEVNRWVI